jgi:protein MPE1
LLERDFVCPNCAKKIASLDKLAMDKPVRLRVEAYIQNVIEESKKEGGDDGDTAGASGGTGQVSQNPTSCSRVMLISHFQQPDSVNLEQDFYSDQSAGNIDMTKMVADSIPQLQAQITQISAMLQNPALPNQVRQNTQMQYHQLQMQLAQAQDIAAAMVMAGFQQQQLQNNVAMNYNMQGYNNQAAWANNGLAQDSAYQRQPVNNRRRVVKRDRPQDFLEIGGEPDTKVPRYWE